MLGKFTKLIGGLNNQTSQWTAFFPLGSSFMPFLESSNNSLSKEKSLHRPSLSCAVVSRNAEHLNAFSLFFFEKELQQFRVSNIHGYASLFKALREVPPLKQTCRANQDLLLFTKWSNHYFLHWSIITAFYVCGGQKLKNNISEGDLLDP